MRICLDASVAVTALRANELSHAVSRARNDLQNVAVMIAGAVLTQLTGGRFSPEHTGDVFDAREALEMGREDWQQLIGADAPRGVAARRGQALRQRWYRNRGRTNRNDATST